MAVKTKSLDSFDSDIEKLQKQIEKVKQDRKRHEESLLLKIGRAYAQLVNLDNKDVQNKKQAIKNQKSQDQNQQG